MQCNWITLHCIQLRGSEQNSLQCIELQYSAVQCLDLYIASEPLRVSLPRTFGRYPVHWILCSRFSYTSLHWIIVRSAFASSVPHPHIWTISNALHWITMQWRVVSLPRIPMCNVQCIELKYYTSAFASSVPPPHSTPASHTYPPILAPPWSSLSSSLCSFTLLSSSSSSTSTISSPLLAQSRALYVTMRHYRSAAAAHTF